MVIEARHFDTRLNQWIHTDNNPDNPDSLLKEELKNSLLEHFLPGVNFSFGHMDEKATDTQLKNHPEGHKLLLSSKSRLLYGSEESLETISKLCPDNKDRGAYGSIFLGSCKNAISAELNILIVDDTTGENGGIINNDQAYRLVGDCYGQISTELYHQLTRHQEGDQYRVIQHRFGWTDKDGNDDKFRFGKGTLGPANLDQILSYQQPNQPKIDLVIPLSAFKGTDKDNPSGPTKPQIKPGLYRQNMWLGEKSQSELGKTAISQMIASFPSGLKDFGEQVELEAAKLKEALDDPRKIAQLYCEKYEKRKAFLEQQAAELEEEAAVNPEVTEELETLRERVATDTSIYKLIKTDLEGSGQLLETEKIQRELARFVQGEWQDISVGKTLTFERAMVIPSKDLQNGEICIPHYQDGEEVLNFRSPFLNSNGLCVSTNKIVDDVLGPDGKPLAGVIAVSDETSDRIYNRLNEQIKSILPEAQGKNRPLEGIENYLDQNIGKLETKDKIEFSKKFNQYISELQSGGYELEILPQESEQERQARDYDGDCIGFDHASKYPNLTAEAIWRNLPENAYDPTVKLKKQSFYREDGNQPEFEEIAIHMSDGISVGTINNHLTSIEALESEVTILKIFGSEKDQVEYVIQVAKHYEDLLKTEAWAKSKGIEGKEVPEKYRSYMEEFVQAAGQEPLNQANALKAMNINTRMYRKMIAEAAFQNQIAVDLFKSAKKPDMEIIRNNSRILHREVNYIKDKKKDVYIENTIQPTGYSPVEILISKTNQYFEKARLESRELAQFSNLFKEVEFTHDQRLQATLAKKEFDKEFNNATRYTQRKKVEKGPSASVDIGGGKKLDITNLLKSDHPLVWNAQKITLKVSEIAPEKRSKDKPHKYRVVAQINDDTENGKPKFRTLGTVSKEQENSLKELGIVPNQEITSTKIFFQPELSEGQIKLMYLHAYQIAENFYNSIPEDQKLAMAAASWAVSTTREGSNSKNQNQVEQEVERQKKVSNFVYASFPQEIIKQIETLQFTDFTLTGHDRKSQIIKLENQVSPQEVRFNISEHKDSKGNTVIRDVIEVKSLVTGEYETFANINATDGKLPIGTTGTGNIERGEVYTATITTKIPGLPELNFQVKELQKFQCKDQTFSGEQVNLTIIKDKLEREDYVITFKSGNKEEKLGTLSKESVKVGIEQGWLAEKPGQSGQKLQLEITSIAIGENAFAIGKTSNGNLVRIDINDKLKNREFKGKEISVTIKAYDKQDVYTAKIGNLSLGIIGQYTEKAFGNRSRYGQNKSTVQQLVNAGIINENKVQTTIPVIITSNETTCKLSIDPESVQYPETWVKRHQLVDQQKEVSLVEQKNNQLFDKITERPTIIFQSQEDKLVGLVGLTVDSKKAEITKKYLDQVGITYDQVPKLQSRLEAKKGMTVFMLDESTISSEKKEQFLERFSGIKSNDAPPLPAPIIPEETVYFNNPNQQYTLEDNSQAIKESIGLVVPVQDAIAVNDWLEFQGINNNYILDKDSNIAIFLIEKNTIIGELQKDLNNLLGEAINIGEVDGFDQYEQLSNKLNQRVKEQGSLLKINSTLQPSQYKQALQSLPNRPKELGREEISVPMTPAKPVQEKNTANTELSILYKQISPIIKTQVTTGNTTTAIFLPSSREADQTKAIEIMGKVSSEKVEQLRSHLETHIIPVLETDKSNYAPGRQVAWVGAKWDLKDKDFKPGVQDDKLMELVKQVYPDADIVLVTYSSNPGAGINYHRDDSYAATEARSINIGNSDWGYRAAKEQMAWTREENKDAPYQEFKLESGTVTRFNCKNEHAALNTEAGRWSINIWSIKNDLDRDNSVRQKFEDFLKSNQPKRAVVQSSTDLTIKANEWTPGGEIKIERSYTSLKEASQNRPAPAPNQPTVEEIIAIGNKTIASSLNPQIPENLHIAGNVPMNYGLHTYGEAKTVPVDTTINAMRGHGRVHTTRGVDYQKTYGIKEGDIAIAVGGKGEKVAFRVGKQYEITPQLIQNPAYQQAWAKWEKHSHKELTQTQASKSKLYGLFMEPLGDYANGKIVPFPPVQKQTPTSVNISPDSKDGLGAALSLATALAKEEGKLQNDYQVSVNNNPEAADGQSSETPAKNNLLANLQPINPAVAEHMKKDIAMAEIATQFIGKSAAPPETPSSTRNYEQAWGDRANTGNYSASDVIMVSGSGPWRGVTNEQIKHTFEKEYVPLLNAAIEAKSSFVVGNAKGTDQLVQNYLTERGYQIKLSNVGAASPREGYAKLCFIENIKDINEASTYPENTTTTSEIPGDAVTQQKTSKSTKNQTSLINTKPEQTDTRKTSSTENLLTQVPQFAPGINLNSRSPDPLGAVLTSTTVKSKEIGAIVNDYPVSFRDNQEMPAGIYGPETYTKSKPAGQPFLSVEQAFYAYKETVPLKEPRVQLMAEILQARFEQHPKLMEAVTERGGAEWLKQCSYLVSNKEKNFWEGKGLQSPYIRALTQGYTKALENSNSRATENQTASIIQPTPSQEPLPEPQTRFSATTFPKNPQTISTDIQQALSQTQTNSQTNSLDKTLDNIKQSTVQNLQNWYEAAQKLGRSEKYLNRIQEVTAQYINDSSYSLENAFKAMSRDVNELKQINEITKLAQSVVKVLGKEDINGIMSIKTEKYKNYQIATKAQEETYVIKDKDNNVLLYLREGKTKVNKLNQEVVDDFRFMNFRIEHSLQNIRRELVER